MKTTLLIVTTLFFSTHIQAKNLGKKEIEFHPFLAPVGAIHVDHFNTGTTDLRGPATDSELEVKSHYMGKVPLLGRLGINTCLNFLQDHEKNLYAFCAETEKGFMKGISFHLALFNPKTLKKLAKYKFYEVSLINIIKNKLPMNLGYFVMDNQGRVIVSTKEGKILFIKKNDKNQLKLVKTINVPSEIKNKGLLSQVIPDYGGNYWFFMPGEKNKNHAYLGHISKDDEKFQIAELTNELIENGLAVDSTGVYLASSKAMYKFRIEDGPIKMVFREEYETSSTHKKGTISKEGSGTTPTLMRNDLVVITDNADERVNLLVFDRSDFMFRDERLVCKVPLFKPGKSSVENSVIVHKNSIIVQNWHNAPAFMGSLKDMEPGITRIDVRADKSGCDVIWNNTQSIGTSTLKLSTSSGLLYLPTQNSKRLPREKSYMEFIDFETGKVARKVYIGRGLTHRFLMSPVYFGTMGEILQPIYSGFVSIKEKAANDKSNELSPEEQEALDDQSNVEQLEEEQIES